MQHGMRSWLIMQARYAKCQKDFQSNCIDTHTHTKGMGVFRLQHLIYFQVIKKISPIILSFNLFNSSNLLYGQKSPIPTCWWSKGSSQVWHSSRPWRSQFIPDRSSVDLYGILRFSGGVSGLVSALNKFWNLVFWTSPVELFLFKIVLYSKC